MKYSDYEKTRKSLMRLIRFIVEQGKDSSLSLDDKIKHIQVSKDLQKALDLLRINTFKIDDILGDE